MTIFNKYALAFSAVALMAACSSEKDDYGYTQGEWDANKDYAEVAFEVEEQSIELDPSEETSTSIIIKRKNTQGELVMPLDIIENTDNVFKVSDAKFAAGEAEAEVKIEFPDAVVGKPYTLKLAVSDPKYVSSYSDAVLYTFNVTRVKWNPAGYVEDEGKKVEGYAMYTDDIISSYWTIDQLTYPVRLEERDDNPGMYRIINPYSEYWPYAAYADGTKDYYLYIDATDPEYVFITNGLTDLGVNINDKGTHEVLSFVNYYADGKGYDLEDPDQLDKFKKDYPQYGGKYENGMITFPVQALLQAVGGDGYYYANSHGKFCLLIDPSKNPYIATIENDFEWEEKYTGAFTSNMLGASGDATLYIGTCATTTDDCDKRFEKEWGTAYLIASPYKEDYNLIFTVKDGDVLLPDGYEYQATGLKALNEDVYAHINIAHSSFTEKTVTLNITFTNSTGEIEYGTTDEVLSNITWTNLGTGLYTDDMLAPLFGGEATTYEVEILERDDMPGLYRVMNPYSNSVYPFADDDCAEDGLYLEVDAQDKDGVYMLVQDLGFDWGYGPIAIGSEGGYYIGNGYSFAQVKNAGMLGTLRDGVITFPVATSQSGVSYQGLVFMGESGYYGGSGKWQIVLPEAVPAMIKRAPKATTSVKHQFSGIKSNVKKVNPFAKKTVKTIKKQAKKAL